MWWSTAARALLALGLFVFFFPSVGAPLGRGLDPSWEWGVNAIRHTGLVHGRDVFFPYGPLGYLLRPQPVGDNVIMAMSVGVLAHAAWVAAWIGLVACRLSLPAFLAICAALIPSMADIDSRPVLLVVLLCALGWEDAKRGWVWSSLAGALAMLLLFVKFSMGIAAGGAVGMMWLLAAGRRSAHVGRLVMASAVGAAVVAAGIIPWQFGGIGACARWMRGSLELAQGYSVAMSLPGPARELRLALAGLAGYAAALAAAARFAPRLAVVLWIGLWPLFSMFKHGFVRQDSHVAYFFVGHTGLGAVALAMSRARREWLISSVLATAALALLTVDCRFRWTTMNAMTTAIAGGWRHALSLLDPSGHEARLRAESEKNLEPLRIPEVARVSTDVVPWELMIAPANDLPWRPPPTLQIAGGHTAWLDAENARHYAGPRAAEQIILRYDDLDHMPCFWISPAAWQVLFRRYQIDPTAPRPALRVPRRDAVVDEFAVLRRMPEAFAVAPVSLGRRAVRPDQWIEVPDSPGLVAVRIRMAKSVRGKLAGFLFRLDRTYLNLLMDNGQYMACRFLPDPAANGLIINHVPTGDGALADLFAGRAETRVRAIQIAEPGMRQYRPEIEVEFVEWPRPVAYRPRPFMFKALQLRSRTGRLQTDADSIFARARVARPAEHRPGTLGRSPGFFLARGRYVITFRLWIADASRPSPVTLAIDGGQVNIRRTIAGSELAGDGHWAEIGIPLEFTTPISDELRASVRFNGECEVRLDCISITPEPRPAGR